MNDWRSLLKSNLNLIFFGPSQTYHIAPLMIPRSKPGRGNSALYTDTTIALNADTGKLVWYFQHMTRDVWDLDWSFERMITTLTNDNKSRKVVMTMGKIGVLDVLDAATGKYLFSYDLGLQNIVTKIDPVSGLKTTDPALEPDSKITKFVCPFAAGIRNWPGTSYDSQTHLLYVPVTDSCMDFGWNLGEGFDITFGVKPRPGSNGNFGGVAAINVQTRSVEWTRRQRAPESSAMLATSGGLLFEGGRDRYFRASDSATGKILWRVRLDNIPSAAPISFMAGGQQLLAVTTGGGNPSEATFQGLTPEIEAAKRGTTLFVFKVGNPSATQ